MISYHVQVSLLFSCEVLATLPVFPFSMRSSTVNSGETMGTRIQNYNRIEIKVIVNFPHNNLTMYTASFLEQGLQA